MKQGLIQIGNYRLDVRIVGHGWPAVVCLSSAGGAHEQWEAFTALMSTSTAVVTYGRPGLGQSEPLTAAESETPRGGGWLARQLRSLLHATEIEMPVVLVTGSIGAYIGDQYAALWPDEVAGLVLVDPTPLRNLPGLTNDRGDTLDGGEPGGTLIGRELSYAEQRANVPINRDGRFVVLSSAVGRWLRNEPMQWHQPLSLAEVDAHWIDMQREWAARLNARQVVAATAGHLVHKEEPALAVAVVREVVDASREDRPVQLPVDLLIQAGARAVR